MTPHELNLRIEAYLERMKFESESALATSYLTAYLQRARKMPAWNKLIKDLEAAGPKKTKPKQSEQEMLKNLRMATGSKAR